MSRWRSIRVMAPAILACALFGGPARAGETTLVQDFDRLCVKAAGELETLTRLADAEGWRPVPPAPNADMSLFPDGAVVRARGDPGAARNLVFSRVAAGPNNPSAVCTVAEGAPVGDAEAMMRAYLGGPPTQRQGPMTLWVMRIHDGRSELLASANDSLINPLIASGALAIYMAGDKDGRPVLMLLTYAKPAP